jgi:hypothetical protein
MFSTDSLRVAGLAHVVVAFGAPVHEQPDADFAKADIAAGVLCGHCLLQTVVLRTV